MRFSPTSTFVISCLAACGTTSTDAPEQAGSGDPSQPPDVQSETPAPGAAQPDAPDAQDEPALPLHVTERLDGAPDLLLSTATTIDTTALTINGATNAFFVRQAPYAVLFVHALDVEAPVAITGDAALIVVADATINVHAAIDLHAVGATPGPGALTSGPGAGTGGIMFKDSQRDILMSSGGGGGSYGRAGALGGSRDATLAPPGAGGAVYGSDSPADPLVGGSPGGYGGATVGAPGAGGGALQLSSAVSIEIGGPINAGGGGGTGNGIEEGGGSGGGAGGAILLEAPTMTMVSGGFLAANGGGGGGGGNLHSGGRPGGDGADGRASLQRAAGGLSGIPMGGTGGAGAADVWNGVDGESNSFGGGGGGGVGRIFIRFRSATPPTILFDNVSPHVTFDATL